MAQAIQLIALVAYLVAVVLATRWIVVNLLPRSARRWAWLPLAAALIVLPFADELYNERQAQLACANTGGLAVAKTIIAQTPQEGLALIETRRLDTEEEHFWKHELLFIYRPSGDELARLRWFDRKRGWLRGNEPGSGYGSFFKASPCPDPQPYLAGGGVRAQLVNPAGGTRQTN